MTNFKKRMFILFFTMIFTVMNPLQMNSDSVITAQAANTKTHKIKTTLNKKKANLYIGNTLKLSLNVTNKKISWSSSDAKIATVSSSGLVTAISSGKVTITAKLDKKKYKCFIRVLDQHISKSTLTMLEGDQETLSFNGVQGLVTWESSNEMIAKVNSKGQVTAICEGTANITATYQQMKYICSVNVIKRKFQATTTNISCYHNEQIRISVSDHQTDEVLTCTSADGTIAQGEFGNWVNNEIPLYIIPKGHGTTTLTITSKYSGQKLVIHVTSLDVYNRVDTATLTPQQVYDQCMKSMVKISTNQGFGSGFFIENNRIITRYDIIEDAFSISVQTYDGMSYPVKRVVGYDKALDIAILEVDCSYDPMVLNQHGVKTGETTYVLGYNSGAVTSFFSGTVTDDNTVIDGKNYIESNNYISIGNSGGPLLNAYGEVIGINIPSGTNINRAIAVNQIYKVSIWHPVAGDEFVGANSADTFEDETRSYTMENSQVLNKGVHLYGMMTKQQSNNTDYYKFHANQNEAIMIKFAAAVGYDRIRLVIYNDSKKQVVYYLNNTNVITENTLQLPEGDYYIFVEHRSEYVRDMDIPYMLLIQ